VCGEGGRGGLSAGVRTRGRPLRHRGQQHRDRDDARPSSEIGQPSEEQTQRMLEMFGRPIVRRRGEPEEVAGLVANLASPLGGWVSGQTSPVNGGHSIAL
jgi:3-oxoacyl-[acyl-carrier protein] reductase